MVLTFLAVAASLWSAFLYAPTEIVMGHIQRIFYFHMGAVWAATVAFTVVFVASIAFLRTGKRRWDALALAAAEVGVLFITLTIVSGSIWARPVWGAWWTWDPQLTTTFILWVLYIAYLLLRSSAAGGQRRARFAAVFAVVAYIDLPLVYISARVMRGISPVVFGGEGGGIESRMWVALLSALVAFTLLLMVFLKRRYDLEMMADRVESIVRKRMEGR